MTLLAILVAPSFAGIVAMLALTIHAEMSNRSNL